MEDQILQNLPALRPHKYPLWIKIFAIILLAIFIYTAPMLPRYIISVKKLKLGIEAYNNKQYSTSIMYFNEILKSFPTSKIAKIAVAKAYFANSNKEDDLVGLGGLSDIELSKDEWQDLSSVMPNEYQEFFKTVIKK